MSYITRNKRSNDVTWCYAFRHICILISQIASNGKFSVLTLAFPGKQTRSKGERLAC